MFQAKEPTQTCTLAMVLTHSLALVLELNLLAADVQVGWHQVLARILIMLGIQLQSHQPGSSRLLAQLHTAIHMMILSVLSLAEVMLVSPTLSLSVLLVLLELVKYIEVCTINNSLFV
jgi:hypothetical protein